MAYNAGYVADDFPPPDYSDNGDEPPQDYDDDDDDDDFKYTTHNDDGYLKNETKNDYYRSENPDSRTLPPVPDYNDIIDIQPKFGASVQEPVEETKYETAEEPADPLSFSNLANTSQFIFFKASQFSLGGKYAMLNEDGAIMYTIDKEKVKSFWSCAKASRHFIHTARGKMEVMTTNFQICDIPFVPCNSKIQCYMYSPALIKAGRIVERNEDGDQFKVKNADGKTVLRINYNHKCCACCCNCADFNCCSAFGAKLQCLCCSSLCNAACCPQIAFPIFNLKNKLVGFVGSSSPSLATVLTIRKEVLFYVKLIADVDIESKKLLIGAALFLNDRIFKSLRRIYCCDVYMGCSL